MTSQTATGLPKRQSPVRVRNRRRVLRAARALVAERGLEALTMRQLALEADLSVASLYNLIGSRDDVVRALGLFVLDELGEAFVHVEASDPLERAQLLLTTVLDTVTENIPHSLVLALLSDVQIYSELTLSWQPDHALANEIHSMVAAGMLTDDVSVSLMAKQVWWSHMGYLRQWAVGRFTERELRAGALYSLDLCLLAVATPFSRKRLLDHAHALEVDLDRY